MDFARNERGFCVGFAWNLILFSFVREREGYKHHADCTVPQCFGMQPVSSHTDFPETGLFFCNHNSASHKMIITPKRYLCRRNKYEDVILKLCTTFRYPNILERKT